MECSTRQLPTGKVKGRRTIGHPLVSPADHLARGGGVYGFNFAAHSKVQIT